MQERSLLEPPPRCIPQHQRIQGPARLAIAFGSETEEGLVAGVMWGWLLVGLMVIGFESPWGSLTPQSEHVPWRLGIRKRNGHQSPGSGPSSASDLLCDLEQVTLPL